MKKIKGINWLQKIYQAIEALSSTISNGSGSGSGSNNVMVVEGTVDENDYFTPDDGQPSFDEAKEHFLSGGTLQILFDGTYNNASMFYTRGTPHIVFVAGNDSQTWANIWEDPNSSGGGK